jgi:lysophospholipase L1-like esterase
MVVGLVILGVLAALAATGLALFTLGEVFAVLVLLLVIAGIVAGIYFRGTVGNVILAGFAVLFVGSIAFGGWSAYQVVSALTDNSGPADPADPVALASIERKLDEAEGNAGFRIALTEEELTAFLQDAIADEGDTPIKRVTLDVVDGNGDENGRVNFDLDFKSGSLDASGSVTAKIEAGEIKFDIADVDIGNLTLPGIATGAVNDLLNTVLDLNEELAKAQADVQAIEIGDGEVAVVGAVGGGDIISASDLLGALQQNAAAIGNAVTPPSEQLSSGRAGGDVSGASYVVAIGDSLTANVGVSDPRDGFVSRFHAEVERRDGATYGLRNFGVSGETSGTVIRGGQLEAALDFMRDNDIAYVTIDIGANDFLGHLGSADCSESLTTPECQARLEPTLAAYRPNLERVLDDLRDAAGDDATIVFLTVYNPFSLGFGAAVGLEAATDEVTQELNALAAEVAGERDILVADGFSPMSGTTGATTHMLDAPPDIHPKAIGYDVLAVALIAALP